MRYRLLLWGLLCVGLWVGGCTSSTSPDDGSSWLPSLTESPGGELRLYTDSVSWTLPFSSPPYAVDMWEVDDGRSHIGIYLIGHSGLSHVVFVIDPLVSSRNGTLLPAPRCVPDTPLEQGRWAGTYSPSSREWHGDPWPLTCTYGPDVAYVTLTFY